MQVMNLQTSARNIPSAVRLNASHFFTETAKLGLSAEIGYVLSNSSPLVAAGSVLAGKLMFDTLERLGRKIYINTRVKVASKLKFARSPELYPDAFVKKRVRHEMYLALWEKTLKGLNPFNIFRKQNEKVTREEVARFTRYTTHIPHRQIPTV